MTIQSFFSNACTESIMQVSQSLIQGLTTIYEDQDLLNLRDTELTQCLSSVGVSYPSPLNT